MAVNSNSVGKAQLAGRCTIINVMNIQRMYCSRVSDRLLYIYRMSLMRSLTSFVVLVSTEKYAGVFIQLEVCVSLSLCTEAVIPPHARDTCWLAVCTLLIPVRL